MIWRLICMITGHWWKPSVYNTWYIPIEEGCSCCGQYRWHGFEHQRGFLQEPDWQDGKHPRLICE
jgi:hypothetical protein